MCMVWSAYCMSDASSRDSEQVFTITLAFNSYYIPRLARVKLLGTKLLSL